MIQSKHKYLTIKQIVFILGISLHLLSSCHTTHKSPVSDEKREQSVATLRNVLHQGVQWEKVYAAEFLLALSYPEGIYEVFKDELRRHEELPVYRIGIWRVLAQCADKNERPLWQEKIYRAFTDESAPDRAQAAEALAKLKIPYAATDSSLVVSASQSDDKILSLYALWWKGVQPEMNPDVLKATLLDVIYSASEPLYIKQLAASVIKEEKTIQLNAQDWNKLKESTFSEPETTELKPYLAAMLLSTSRSDSLNAAIKELFYTSLWNSRTLFQIFTALAEKGIPNDLFFLYSLSERNENELKSAIAYATLRIDRRQTYSFAWQDVVVIMLFMTGMILIGVFYSKRNKTAKDYIYGGGNMSALAIGISLFATMVSSLSYLANPGEMIKYGPMILSGIIAFPAVYLVVGWFIVPKFMKYNVNSAYELLEIKLGTGVRMMATFFFLSLRFLWMATIMFVTVETVLRTMFAIPAEYSTLIGILLIVITFVYSSLGGLKAVVFTDVVQAGLMWAGTILAVVIVSVKLGSFGSIIPDHWLSNWSELKWGLDPKERLTVGNAVLTLFVWYICTAGSDQMAIQRYMATKNARTARRSYGVSLLSDMTVNICLGLVGLAMLAFFTANPHLLSDGNTISTQADHLFPRFILIGFPAGITGCVVAGILAAAMSSLSSGLNSTATVISVDIVKRFFKRRATSSEATVKQMRLITMIIGVGILLLSLFVGQVEGNLYDVVVKVVNLFVAPLFVLFFMALYVPFATSFGTCFGGLVSVGTAIASAFFGFMGITVLWIMPAALIAGIVAGTLASLFFNHKGHKEGTKDTKH